MLCGTTSNPCACTIYDIPFMVGHPVWFTGCAVSVVCKFAVTAAAPYATPAAVFFGVLGVITGYGHYRSRSSYLAEKKIVKSIEAQSTELKGVTVKVGDAADTMAGVDADWKRKADQLATDKRALEEQNGALTRLCATLRKENGDLRSTAGRIADSAQSDATTVGRLADTTRTFGTDIAAGVAAEAALRRDADGISHDLGDIKNDSDKLDGSVRRVEALVQTLRTHPAGGSADATAHSLAALAQATHAQIDALK